MAKRKQQDNLGDILILANRKVHSQAIKTIERQKQVIEFMRRKKSKRIRRRDLEQFLNLQFSHLADEKEKKQEFWRKRKKFYKIMSPLLQTCIESDREELTYTLNPVKITYWFDSLRRTIKEVFG